MYVFFALCMHNVVDCKVGPNVTYRRLLYKYLDQYVNMLTRYFPYGTHFSISGSPLVAVGLICVGNANEKKYYRA